MRTSSITLNLYDSLEIYIDYPQGVRYVYITVSVTLVSLHFAIVGALISVSYLPLTLSLTSIRN